jgi:hypothetical protein
LYGRAFDSSGFDWQQEIEQHFAKLHFRCLSLNATDFDAIARLDPPLMCYIATTSKAVAAAANKSILQSNCNFLIVPQSDFELKDI